MGRTAVHTQEQVFEAADKMAANGQEATPNGLRDVLGRGSYSTFVKHIDAWQQARKAKPSPVVLEMPDSVKAAFSQCWHAAANVAGKEISAIRDKADAEIKGTKRRLEEAIAAIEQIEGEAECETARLEAAEAALSDAQIASQLDATAAAAREAALSATANQIREQIRTQQSELDRVHAETKVTRSQHAAEITKLTVDFSRQLAEAVERLDATSDREREKIAETAFATFEVVRLGDRLRDNEARNVEIFAELKKTNLALESALIVVRKESRDLSAQLGQATGELEALRTQVVGQTDVIKGFAASAQGVKKTQ